jgi:hypothetical protein
MVSHWINPMTSTNVDPMSPLHWIYPVERLIWDRIRTFLGDLNGFIQSNTKFGYFSERSIGFIQ